MRGLWILLALFVCCVGLTAQIITFTSPLGPGSILINIGPLPPFGTYFFAATVNAGLFPAGWFFGIDIGFAELASEITFGFPFSGPVPAAGAVMIGPFLGMPSGLTVYAVALGMPGPVLGPPVAGVSPPVMYTIP